MKQKKWLIVWWFINIILIVVLLGDVIYNNFLFKVRDYVVAVYFIIWGIIVIKLYINKIKF
jgi:hypothetical protein